MDERISETDPTVDVGASLLTPTAALGGEFVLPAASDAERSAVAATDTAVDRLAFRLGPLGLLCEPDAGREVVLPPPISHVPHTAPWMLGLANVRGALVPVVDLAVAFELERATELRPYLLIIGGGDDVLGLLVDGLPVLQRFETGERIGGIPPHPQLLHGHVKAGYDRGGMMWLDVDLNAFFKTLDERIAQAA